MNSIDNAAFNSVDSICFIENFTKFALLLLQLLLLVVVMFFALLMNCEFIVTDESVIELACQELIPKSCCDVNRGSSIGCGFNNNFVLGAFNSPAESLFLFIEDDEDKLSTVFELNTENKQFN